MNSLVLFSHKFGQLGNRLFAFSHLIANAKAHNYAFVNLPFDEYADYFEGLNKDVLCRYPPAKSIISPNWLRSLFFTMNRAILKGARTFLPSRSFLHEIIVADLPEYQFSDGTYYSLSGEKFQKVVKEKGVVFLFGRFFRDFDNVIRYQQVIRDVFKPVALIQNNVDTFLAKVRKPNALLVGVHIRRGDYQHFAERKYFYSHEEYGNKMRELQNASPQEKITFIICSNETVDAKNFEGIDFSIGPGHIVEDMYIFAGCDLLMGPPSTFTRWASFYGKVPLLQLYNLKDPARKQDFVFLPPEKLFDF